MKKHKNTLDKLHILFILISISLFVTIISSIYFNNIPLFFEKGLYDKVFWSSFLINLHNSLIDIFIFWFLLIFINSKYEKNKEFNKCISELSLNSGNIRNKNTIMDNIKLLNRLNLIDKTKHLYLPRLNLTCIKFKEYNLEWCNFTASVMDQINVNKSIFLNSILRSVSLIDWILTNSDFNNSDMRVIKCKNTSFKSSNLSNCDLARAKLESSFFCNTSFKWSNFEGVSYDNSDFSNANFIWCKNIDVPSLLKATSIFKAKFDINIVNLIQEQTSLDYIYVNQLQKEKPTMLN